MHGLYIHIPFCEKKCAYCDFCSIVGDSSIMADYIDSVITESQRYKGMEFDTIFIGGGTPTVLPKGELTRLINGISKYLDLKTKEFTIEGNPNSYTPAKMEEFKAIGMTRASVGVQSFNESLLRSLGRVHNGRQAEECIKNLVNAGFDVSCDIMIGLAGQSKQSVADDITKAVSLGVCHLSCYGLIVEEGTPLHNQVSNGQVALPNDDDVADIYDLACDILQEKGLSRYEISNFGKPCLHNLGYWQQKPYLGLGASAHSLIGNTRYFNTDNIVNYINGEMPKVEEVLSSRDLVNEGIILGLRTIYGVNVDEIKQLFGDKEYNRILKVVNEDSHCYEVKNGILTMKQKFWYCQNQLLSKF